MDQIHELVIYEEIQATFFRDIGDHQSHSIQPTKIQLLWQHKYATIVNIIHPNTIEDLKHLQTALPN